MEEMAMRTARLIAEVDEQLAPYRGRFGATVAESLRLMKEIRAPPWIRSIVAEPYGEAEPCVSHPGPSPAKLRA
jgi:hypothetical protein